MMCHIIVKNDFLDSNKCKLLSESVQAACTNCKTQYVTKIAT